MIELAEFNAPVNTQWAISEITVSRQSLALELNDNEIRTDKTYGKELTTQTKQHRRLKIGEQLRSIIRFGLHPRLSSFSCSKENVWVCRLFLLIGCPFRHLPTNSIKALTST